MPVALFSNGCDLSLFPGNCGARSLRFLFYVWANSQIAIRDLANVARAKHNAETDREEMRKEVGFLPGIEPGIFGIFNELFNEPVSTGKQFKFCSKRRAIGFLFDDK